MAVAREPEHSDLLDAIFALGSNFFVQGKYDKAEIIFNGLMAVDPDHLGASIALGEVFMRAGQVERALEHFLIENKKFVYEARFWLGAAKACFLLSKYEEAKKLVQPIVEGEIICTPSISLMAKLIYDQVKGFSEN